MEVPVLKRRDLLLAALGTAVAPAALAQSARFAVEAIVFRQPGAPAAPTAGEPARDAVPTGRVAPLPRDAWQLGNLQGGLQRAAGYRVLAHGAWSADVPANGSVAARVDDVLPASGLSGTIAVQRGQYLFVRLDLDYAPVEGGVIRMRERRRVKFNERHYFDHPALGVIAVVSPLG
jgi:hypothetical protein